MMSLCAFAWIVVAAAMLLLAAPALADGRIFILRDPPDRDVAGSVWVMNPDGSGLRKVIDEVESAAVSRDGRTLVYLERGVMWTAPWTGRAVRRLTRMPAYAYWIAPDGAHVAVLSVEGDGGLYLAETASGRVRRVAAYGDEHVAWAPDSKSLAYAGEGEIRIIDVETGELKLLLSAEDFRSGLLWSPDGAALAYVGSRNELVIVPLDGAAPRIVARKIGTRESVAWSPDGREVVVASDELERRGELLAVNVLTGVKRRIARLAGATLRKPVWAPNGTAVAFELRDDTGRDDIWIAPRDSSRPRPITSFADLDADAASLLGWVPGAQLGRTKVQPDARVRLVPAVAVGLPGRGVIALAAEGRFVAASVADGDGKEGLYRWRRGSRAAVRIYDQTPEARPVVSGGAVAWIEHLSPAGPDFWYLKLRLPGRAGIRTVDFGVPPVSAEVWPIAVAGGGGALFANTYVLKWGESEHRPRRLGRVRIWRIDAANATLLPGPGGRSIAAAGAAYAAVIRAGGLEIMLPTGSVVARVALEQPPIEAYVAHDDVALVWTTHVDVRRAPSLARTRRLNLPRGSRVLAFGGGLLAFVRGDDFVVVNVENGAQRSFALPAQRSIPVAALVDAGLYVAWNRGDRRPATQIGFVPRAQLVRLLGTSGES